MLTLFGPVAQAENTLYSLFLLCHTSSVPGTVGSASEIHPPTAILTVPASSTILSQPEQCDSFLTGLLDSALTSPAHSRILFIQQNRITPLMFQNLQWFPGSQWGKVHPLRWHQEPGGVSSHHLATLLLTRFPSKPTVLTTLLKLLQPAAVPQSTISAR